MAIQCVYFEAGIVLFIHYSDEIISTKCHIAHDIASTITYTFKMKFLIF
jgi:hypothetical protein